MGTERHESRRIDNQLRGRSGRQGDPGTSKFFLSREDDLMRIFGSERMSAMLKRLGLPEGEALIHPWISHAIEKAQQKVEERNFDIRKNLLKYDNVMNDQRKVIYEQRRELMTEEDISETVEEMRDEYLDEVVRNYIPHGSQPLECPLKELKAEMFRITGMDMPIEDWANEAEADSDALSEKVRTFVVENIKSRNKDVPDSLMHMVEKSILLQVLDQLWKDHIAALEQMRHTIVLRAYGQKDPLNEYKKEAFNMFSEMLDLLRERLTFLICRVQIQMGDAAALQNRGETPRAMKEVHEEPQSLITRRPAETPRAEQEAAKASPFAYSKEAIDPKDPTTWGKVSRNDPCPCGSGLKYKHCHGKI